MREVGAQKFHNVAGGDFNLDHVVISNSSIYVIETKTYSKPEKGEAKILYSGDLVFLHGKIESKKLITQVKAPAQSLVD